MLKTNDICPVCDRGKLAEQVIVEKFSYKGKKLLIEDYHIFNCDICGEEIVSQKSLKKSERVLTDFRRRVDGLLVSGEIKAIRKKLCMTQIEMAEYLGVAEKTFARYENGQVTQSKAMDLLLRLIDYVPNALPIVKGFISRQLTYEVLEVPSSQCTVSYESESDDEVMEHQVRMEPNCAA